MSFLYLDDGCPDSVDYENNYFHFNSANHDMIQHLANLIAGQDTSDPILRQRVREICEASFGAEPAYA